MMPYWKTMAQRRLLDYETMKRAKENLPQEIAAMHTQPGEDPLDIVAKKLFMRERLRQVRRWLQLTHKGLQVLTPEERVVVQMLYIMPRKGNVTRLCDILDCGQSTVYRRRDRALEKFTVALYGKG